MNDLIKRFRANTPRMEKQKTVEIDGLTLTIAPMSYLDRLRSQSAIKRSTDGDIIVRGDEFARENLYVAAKYALEFKRMKTDTLNELGCDSVEQFVEGTLSHVGIGELCREIDEFTAETQREHESAMNEASEKAGD